MANAKELRGRIKSVGNIRQITKAMEMVASMKLRKVQARAQSNRVLIDELRSLMGRVMRSFAKDVEHAIFTAREFKTIGVFLVTSDRGLCGAYNSNILARFHKLEDELKAQHPGAKIVLYVYGRKGYSYLTRRKYEVLRYFADPPLEKADLHALRIARDAIVGDYLEGKIDAVFSCFTHFVSAGRFEPSIETMLPIDPKVFLAEDGPRIDYLVEPDPETVLRWFVPRYLSGVIYDAMMQSLTSEQAARRMAMKGATDAATRMTKELKMAYNRARQESITKELLDIVGGTAAVS